MFPSSVGAPREPAFPLSPPTASLGDRPSGPALPAHDVGPFPSTLGPQTSKPSLSAFPHYFFHLDGAAPLRWPDVAPFLSTRGLLSPEGLDLLTGL